MATKSALPTFYDSFRIVPVIKNKSCLCDLVLELLSYSCKCLADESQGVGQTDIKMGWNDRKVQVFILTTGAQVDQLKGSYRYLQ